MDLVVANFFQNFNGDLFFEIAVVFFGEYLPYILLLFAVIFILKKEGVLNKIYSFCFITFSLIISEGILATLIKFLVKREKPSDLLSNASVIIESSGFSFPSDHAVFFFTLAFAIYYFNKRWGLWYIVFAFFIGLARIASNVHWVTDVVGGIVISLIGFLITYILMKNYYPDKKAAKLNPSGLTL
ncbi:MAG: phosphatase PAP2 family protein [Candidatus Paceibacterota bacterium]